jgi:hypothetical protein
VPGGWQATIGFRSPLPAISFSDKFGGKNLPEAHASGKVYNLCKPVSAH